MGVKLKDIVEPKTISFKDLEGRSVSIDAFNTLYQFLSTIRQRDGRPLTDENGNEKVLRTVGAKWSYLQSHKFGANAQPFYVALDPTTGKPLTGSRAFNEDIAAYLDFLNQGLTNYRK